MKFYVLFFLLIFDIFSKNWEPEHVTPHVKSNDKSTSSYEIIQSYLTAKDTYLLNKISGDLYVLTEDTTLGSFFWEQIKYQNKDLYKNAKNEIIYNFFISGLASKFVFLVNIKTGLTWGISIDSNGDYVLKSIPFLSEKNNP